jgi:hypothetical protein
VAAVGRKSNSGAPGGEERALEGLTSRGAGFGHRVNGERGPRYQQPQQLRRLHASAVRDRLCQRRKNRYGFPRIVQRVARAAGLCSRLCGQRALFSPSFVQRPREVRKPDQLAS